MSPKPQQAVSRKEAKVGLFLGIVLLLFFIGGGSYLLYDNPDRTELEPVSGVIQSKQRIRSKFGNRSHLEFTTQSHQLYFGGYTPEEIEPHITPGAYIEALVRPHGLRENIFAVEELSVDGRLLVHYEEQRLFFRCFGYIAFFLGIAPAAYTISCWQVLSRRTAA